jgi:hypothetical protein
MIEVVMSGFYIGAQCAAGFIGFTTICIGTVLLIGAVFGLIGKVL